jgi:hypothetical protein
MNLEIIVLQFNLFYNMFVYKNVNVAELETIAGISDL